jgi:hypothetical protein
VGFIRLWKVERLILFLLDRPVHTVDLLCAVYQIREGVEVSQVYGYELDFSEVK